MADGAATMKAWGMQTRASSIEAIEIITRPIPNPAAGEIRVRMVAATTNPVDYKRLYFDPAVYPAAFGVDGAGVVDAVGEGVTDLAQGDRVHFFNNVMAADGTFAEYSIIRAAAAVKIPNAMSFEVAAVVPCAGWTAYEMLFDRCRITRGTTVAINAAAGGVGHLAVQLAVHAGARVAAIVSGEAWCKQMKDYGCEWVIDYRQTNMADELMRCTNGVGFDCILDSVSAETTEKLLPCVRFCGQFVHISCPIHPENNMQLFMRGITTHHVLIVSHFFYGGDDGLKRFARMGEAFDALVIQGAVTPLITKRITFDGVREQLIDQMQGRVKGKVLITF